MMSRVPHAPLPASPTSFVGREQEIVEALRLLDEARLVTITGVGGVGKTRLALEVAAAADAVDGVWFVDLSTVKSASAVANTIANAIGVSDQSTTPYLDKIVDFVGGGEVLLIVDNCEHLIDGAARTISALLRRCPRLRILATSRIVIGVDGEHVFAVAPLTTPDPDDPDLSDLHRFESVGLLIERATAAHHGFALTEQNARGIARLCARLDGLPLAIELAASRLRSLPIDELVDRLEDRFTLLTGGSRAALPRQRTLRALIDWSYDICTAEEKLLWSRLSVFVDSFGLDAVEGVCTDDELPAARAIDTIDSLVSQSVITLVSTGGPPRYRMLETIRRYGWERMVENGEESALERRHADFFAELAAQFERSWFGPGQEAGLARLRLDHGNLRVALDRLVADPQDAERAIQFVADLRYHWCSDGFLSEGRHWIDRAVARPIPPGRPLLQGLLVGAWVMLLQGDSASAAPLLERAEGLADQLADEGSRAELRGWHGTRALFAGDLVEAEAAFSDAVATLRAIHHPERSLLALFQLSNTRAHAGDPRAGSSAREAIAISERLGERWTLSYALWSVGLDAWLRSQHEEAVSMTSAALTIQRDFNDHVGAALMIELTAWIAASRADHRRAAVLLGVISAIWTRIGTDIVNFGPHLERHHDECMSAVVARLAPDVLAELMSTGRAMAHDRAIEYALEKDAAVEAAPAASTILTAREWDIATRVAQGLTNKAIAEQLVLSTRTVDSHVQNILVKLSASGRAQIAAWVVEHRDVALTEPAAR